MKKEAFERLEKEYEELMDKADKLGTFIESEPFKALDQMNKHLLVLQSNVMMSYLNVLSIRLGVNSMKGDTDEVVTEQAAVNGDTL